MNSRIKESIAQAEKDLVNGLGVIDDYEHHFSSYIHSTDSLIDDIYHKFEENDNNKQMFAFMEGNQERIFKDDFRMRKYKKIAQIRQKQGLDPVPFMHQSEKEGS